MGYQDDRGELAALHLRLTPTALGQVRLGAGNQIHAAFLDLLRQSDAALAAQLHATNERRPFTVGLLRGFDHVTAEQRTYAEAQGQPIAVTPGQTYWLRITFLQTEVAVAFTRAIVQGSQRLVLRLGDASFSITRLIGAAGEGGEWVGTSSFADLAALTAHDNLRFTFATPTAFNRGQQPWGKHLSLFPEPALVFGSLARRWEAFAPVALRVTAQNSTPHAIEIWCAENVVVSRHRLETHYLPGARFGQAGFQGDVTFDIKGSRHDAPARWLAPLAGLALYAGVGYKTAMGMGQARWVRDTPVVPMTAEEERDA